MVGFPCNASAQNGLLALPWCSCGTAFEVAIFAFLSLRIKVAMAGVSLLFFCSLVSFLLISISLGFQGDSLLSPAIKG